MQATYNEQAKRSTTTKMQDEYLLTNIL